MMMEEGEKGRRDFVGRDDALPLSGNRLRDSLPERRASERIFAVLDHLSVRLVSRVTASSPHDDKRAISARLHRLYLNSAIPPALVMSIAYHQMPFSLLLGIIAWQKNPAVRCAANFARQATQSTPSLPIPASKMHDGGRTARRTSAVTDHDGVRAMMASFSLSLAHSGNGLALYSLPPSLLC